MKITDIHYFFMRTILLEQKPWFWQQKKKKIKNKTRLAFPENMRTKSLA